MDAQISIRSVWTKGRRRCLFWFLLRECVCFCFANIIYSFEVATIFKIFSAPHSERLRLYIGCVAVDVDVKTAIHLRQTTTRHASKWWKVFHGARARSSHGIRYCKAEPTKIIDSILVWPPAPFIVAVVDVVVTVPIRSNKCDNNKLWQSVFCVLLNNKLRIHAKDH